MAQLREPDFGLGRGYEMGAFARSLVNHGVFGNPFEPMNTGPTAAEPPLFPLFLALIIKIFRSPSLISYAVTFANLAVNSLIAALLPVLSRTLCGEIGCGVAAALLWIVECRLMPGWDASYALLGVILFVLFTARRRLVAGFLPAAAAGTLAGLILLLNPASLLVILPWLVYLWTVGGGSRGVRARYLATVLAVAAVCHIPWIMRNYSIWGQVVIRSNFGMTLYASNNDCASSSTGMNIATGCYGKTHPAYSAVEVERMRSLGEIAYDHRRTAEAVAWIRSHPGRFARLSLERMIQFWLPGQWGTRSNLYATWATTILSIPGLVLLARRRLRLALFFLSIWVVYPMMYYAIMADLRYRYPIFWTSLLPAGYALAYMWGKLKPAPLAVTSNLER